MTTTSRAPALAAPAPGDPASASAVAIISDAPVPHPTLVRTFAAMMAREFRVLGRNLPSTFVRSVVQPLLWVFVFTYVMPPLVMEFSWQRTIEDRALAPVPLGVLAFQKIVAGAVQAFVGALIVIPIVLYVHAAGQAPHAHVTNWLLLALILVAASMLTAALGLLLGTLMDPRKMQMLFAVILLPATMLGCVYYPWSALHHIRWLQIAVLFNPMVYMSEGLRAVLTPGVGLLAMWAILLVLIGGAALIGYLGTRTFTRRVLN